jgi:predicted DNA-binding transcriptional regulator
LDDAPRVAVHAEPQPAPHEAARRASDPTQERLPPENGKAVTRARPATTAGPSAPAHPEPPGLDLLRASAGGFAVSLLLNLLAGYSRIAPDRLLDHPVRRRVHEAASRPGGATVRSVATELGCAESTARYHLEVLRRGGKLRVAVSPLGASYHSPAAPPALQGPPPTLREQIPHAVAASPGMNMSELARRLGVSKRSVQDHVLALLAEGRIESQRAVGARLLFPKGA